MTQAYPSSSATRMSQDFPVLLKTENLEKVTVEVPVSFSLFFSNKGGGDAREHTRTNTHTHTHVFRVSYESDRFLEVPSENCKPRFRLGSVLLCTQRFQEKPKLVAALG